MNIAHQQRLKHRMSIKHILEIRKALLVAILVAGTVVGNATAAQAAPPSNDDITDAIAVTAVPFTDSVNTSEATYAATDTGCGLATVWYRFTPAESGFIDLTTAGSDYDTTLGLHTGEPSALTLEECNDDAVEGVRSRIISEVAAGVTYYISAGTCCSAGETGQVGPGGNLVFTATQVAPPSNDDIADAIVVTAVPFTDSVNTSVATYAATDAGCGLATVWYRFTPAESGFIEFRTVGSDYDTMLGLYTGEPSALTLEECNDHSVYGAQARIISEVAAGVTYYISAGTCCGAGETGQVGPGANLSFTVQSVPPPVTAVTVTVNKAGTVTRAGLVTVTGTIVCDQPAVAHFSAVTMTQRFNRNIVHGGSFTNSACGPEVTVWTVQLASFSGTIFGPGNATASTSAFASNVTGFAYSNVATQTLHLRSAK